MRVILDEKGVCYPDVRLKDEVHAAILTQTDFHVANVVAIDVFRAALHAIPPTQRPAIEWEFYGRIVHFDNNVRSSDAWDDPRTEIVDAALEELLSER